MLTNLLLNTFFSFLLLPVLNPVPARSEPSHGPNMQEVFLVVYVPLPNMHAVAVLLQGLKREEVKLLIKKDV
jgi:hypothetical protein